MTENNNDLSKNDSSYQKTRTASIEGDIRKIKYLMEKTTPVFWGLFLVATALMALAQNGRYQFIIPPETTWLFYKFDTRTGDGFVCGAAFDECVPMTKAGKMSLRPQK